MEPADLCHILITEIGLDAEALTRHQNTPLVDLGLDSLASVELRAVLQNEHGMALPEGVGALTLTELADQVFTQESR